MSPAPALPGWALEQAVDWLLRLDPPHQADAQLQQALEQWLAQDPLHRQAWNWNPPFTATLPVVVFFLLSNIYLVVAPWIPPTDGSVYESLPYWIHVVVGFGILIAGGAYWVVWAVVLPKLGGYELQREVVVDGIDGWERNVFTRKPIGEAVHDDVQPGVFH